MSTFEENSAAAGGAANPGVGLEPGLADMLIRSRQTTLDILEERGYDTTPYRNISPTQILTLAMGHPRALDIVIKKREGSAAPCERAIVVYLLQDRIRTRLGGGAWVRDFYQIPPDATGANEIRKADDVIVIINEPYHEQFDKTSLSLWQHEKARLTFFHIKQVVVHLGKHTLVPPHRKLSPEEAKDAMERLHMSQKSQLPLIKHHDVQSRILGLVPGDIVEIGRPSATAGIATYLRICAA